jgi:hypothetical protein
MDIIFKVAICPSCKNAILATRNPDSPKFQRLFHIAGRLGFEIILTKQVAGLCGCGVHNEKFN